MNTKPIDYSVFGLLTAAALVSTGCFVGGDSLLGGTEGSDDGASDESGGSDDLGDAESDGVDDGADDSDDNATPEPAEGNALVRVIHGSPDAPAVDVYVEGSDEPVIAGLAYTETSEWIEVPEGDYNFQVRAAGSPSTETPVYETGALALEDGAAVSALAAGLLGGEGDHAFRVLPLVEDWDNALADQARVRIVHASADAPTVDIDVHVDGEIEIAGLGRFGETGPDGVGLPADQSLRVGFVAEGELATSVTTPRFGAGDEVILIATGLLSSLSRQDDGFSVLAVGPEGTIGVFGQDPEVVALHASPDVGEIDVCAGDTLLASHITFGQLAGARVSPGTYEVALYASPSNCGGEPLVTDSTGELEAGQRYLAVATGELAPAPGEPPLQVVPYQEHFSLDQGDDAALRLAHGASAPEVDVGVVTGGAIEGGNLLMEGLKWPELGDEFFLQPLTYQIGLAPAGSGLPATPVASFHVPAEAGTRGWVLAAGDLTPETTEAPFRLLVVDTTPSPWVVTELLPNG